MAVPFRVFGIGIHKTGLHSLRLAMKQLGIGPCIQYPHTDDLWMKVTRGKFGFACDMPVDLRFRTLFAAMSKARFILTVREFNPWLRSAVTHIKRRPWEPVSPCGPHREAYGTDFPTAEMLTARFHRHHAAVLEFFEHHQAMDRLLVMDICSGQGWETLCPFLGVDQPDVPFLHENKTPIGDQDE